ncbi:MAG: ribosome small subunit-dependent GTPase A [Fidelibacterota bacterium]
MSLTELGFSDWFQQNSPATDSLRTAQFVSVMRERFIIKNETTEAAAEPSGKLRYNAESALDLPTVGDWVLVDFFDDNTFAVIHRILPRKSILKRKMPGKEIGFQVLAANLDTALIMQSLDRDFNLARLERYLVMVHTAGITPVVLLSKSDLVTAAEIKQKVEEIRQRTGINTVIPFSNLSGQGLSDINNLLLAGMTYCLLGSSGVGKSSLLNSLLGAAVIRTQRVRESDSRGRHTTSLRQLLFLENGAMLIDTPGMRELGNFDIESGMSTTFSEIEELTHQCRFSDCSHEHEKGCAVLSALNEGTISHERYQNFLKMKKEAAFYEMSYREKRQRDKNFGKMVKNVMKNKRTGFR